MQKSQTLTKLLWERLNSCGDRGSFLHSIQVVILGSKDTTICFCQPHFGHELCYSTKLHSNSQRFEDKLSLKNDLNE